MSGTPKRNWEVRAAGRALDRLADADARSLRPKPPATLVAAAQELARDGDFTVKQVADRAGVALQTFYRHFGSKDELMLAVLEENILQGMDEIAKRANKYEDPLDRLAAVVRAPFHMVTAETDMSSLRFQARERVRLSEEFPAEVEACLSPYRDLLIEYIGGAVDAGVVVPVDVSRDADIILHLVLMYTHNVAAHAVPYDADHVADYLWSFCLAGLLRGGADDVAGAPTVSRTAPR
jgi:AcrR family transcriptional regulator